MSQGAPIQAQIYERRALVSSFAWRLPGSDGRGRHPVNEVARETGFLDRERMRRAFLRKYGVPPEALRKNARREAVKVD
jgi:AraC-like DNA-binding protein